MTSKERLLRCIRHQPIDRVPISTYELVGWNPDAWENREISYKTLMDAIREYTDCVYMLNPGLREIPNPCSEQTEWAEGDSHYRKRVFRTKAGSLESLYRRDEGIHTEWTLKHLLEKPEDIDLYLSIPYEAPQLDMAEFYRERDKLGNKGLMMISVDDPICLGAELFEMGNFLMLAMTEQEKAGYFLDAIHERQMSTLKELLKHDISDVIFRICGPEYATPPYMPPSLFHKYVTCYLIKMCREIKEAGGIPRIHCHGKIGKVIEQFALTDADALDPLEPPPDGDMELADIKAKYGWKFCLFGNIELRELECSDRERIDFLVKSAIRDAGEGSGFVLMPSSAPMNVPLSPKVEENYLQLFESAYKYGRY